MFSKQWSQSDLHPPIVTPAHVSLAEAMQSDQLPLGTSSPQRTLRHDGGFYGRRLVSSASDISPHALDRLGVSSDILKKEKGMKKLGICDLDLTRGEELRRYSGIPTKKMSPTTKPEFVFGFTEEQLLRVKAIKLLGTTEQEILDDFCRRISMLGKQEQEVV
ncbi:TPA: hypothetical protein N0F65_008750 [Lagenidium giganteum]|uniref:Uncharacterized protein n=1 Tax=Lagenidium giganteum TaxID=4803 RepID=A0AAV2Z300_9STRA|nr:TPA: hypothetical protein N0F65_008750 [Lagenidium giganteum]